MTQHRGAARQFSAFARPQGDPMAGVSGPMIEIHERLVQPGRGRRSLRAVRMLSHAEAAQLHHELGEALRAFDLSSRLARAVAQAVGEQQAASCSAAVGQQERPRAATAPYPFRDHGTLADHGWGQEGVR